MNGVLAVAINTYREAIRNKVFYVLLLFIALVFFVGGFLTKISFYQEKRVYLDSMAAFLDLFSVFLAMGIGVNLIYKELQNKTIYLILSKPISRHLFLLGKLLGQWMVMWVVIFVMGIAAVFGSYLFGIFEFFTIIKQVIIVIFESLLITSLALLFSSFTTPILTGAFTLGVFIIGRFLPDLQSIIKQRFILDSWRILVERILDFVPQFYLFSISGHEVYGHYVSIASDFVSWGYVFWVGLYSLLYSSLLLLLAAIIFRRKDLV